jgi:Arc/MetJ-type ribon-helix-helix transcriptional regulator
MNDNRITIRLSERLMALLREQSHTERVSVSDIIRAALESKLVAPGAQVRV